MYRMMMKKDIKRNKVILIALFVFIFISAMLTAGGIGVIANLSTAIDEFMTQAETPHFMQMHTGDINQERLDRFVESNNEIKEFQVLEMLNVDNSKLFIGNKSLGESTQDNAFITQSDQFDYLLDLKGQIIKPQKGQVYIPIGYMNQYNVKVGDFVTVVSKQQKHSYEVIGALRDSQMNSSMSSSKRLLINEQDYEELVGEIGKPEYLIEFRLKDIGACSAFENKYVNSGLEANGPTLTYNLFKMVNALSDGMVAGVLILVSIISILVSFLCIRFTLIATLEEDYREIGVMKAIGIHASEIKKMYLGKYSFITGIGCICGYGVSFFISDLLQKNIRLYMGGENKVVISAIGGFIGSMAIYYIVRFFVLSLLKQLEEISPIAALRGVSHVSKQGSVGRIKVLKKRFLNLNIILGIKDIVARKKMYSVLLVVFSLAVFMVIVPLNLYTTLSSEQFITYLGVGKCDVRIDLQQLDNLDGCVERVEQYMNEDKDIIKKEIFKTSSYTALSKDGKPKTLKVEAGNHTTFPLDYVKGAPPKKDNEIALSVINAEQLEKKVGDEVSLLIGNETKKLKICGIYQDITNGGKTAKVTFDTKDYPAMWYVVCVEFAEGISATSKAELYKTDLGYGKISSIGEYVSQILTGMIKNLKGVMVGCMILAVVICMAITILFIKMIILKDQYEIAIMKAIGFSSEDIELQYIARAIMVILLGILIGNILANTIGTQIASMVLSGMGIVKLKVVIDPWLSYLLYPAVLIISVVIATLWSTKSAGDIHIINHITE